MHKEREIAVFSDMSKAEPRSAMSADLDKYAWRMVTYETAEFAGVMLAAAAESEVPEISLPLDLSGWHRMYLGLGKNQYAHIGISVRLSGDTATSYVEGDKAQMFPEAFEEVYWKSADLTGQRVVFRHPEGGKPTASYVVYVKCVPMSDEEVLKCQNNRENPARKRLIGMSDMVGVLCDKRPMHIGQLLEELEPYRNTDFARIDLEYWTYDDSAAHRDGRGALSGNRSIYPDTRHRYYDEARQILRSRGCDYYRDMMQYARSMGLKVYLSRRMNVFAAEVPYDTEFTTAFYKDCPQWRCRDKDGAEIARMSLAYREVQDHLLDTFRKMASYGPDGISLLFNRGMPFMLYEEPLTRGFRERFGTDPGELDERDETWLSCKAEVMTGFIRRIRDVMDECAQREGRERMHLSVHGLASEDQNRLFGIDIGGWAREGLIDEAVAYPIAIVPPNIKTPSVGNVIAIDVDDYARMVKGTACKLYVDMLPRDMEPEAYREKAMEYYAKGADGLCFWDTNRRHPKLRQWSTVSRLGHTGELAAMNEEEAGYCRFIPIQSLNGVRIDRYPPKWGL